MSKIKKILLRAYVTLLLTSVLAVPAFALQTHDELSGGFVSIDGGNCFPIVDSSVSALAFPTVNDSYTASSLVFYIPFSAPADRIVCDLSFLVHSDSFSSASADVGYFYPATTFVVQSSIPASVGQLNWDALSSGLYSSSYGFDFDVSSVSPSDYAWYVRLTVSGTFNFSLRSGSGSVSLSGTSGGGTGHLLLRSTHWNSSYNLFSINTTSTGLQYVRLASSGNTGHFFDLFNNSNIVLPSSDVVLSGSVGGDSLSFLSPISVSSVVHSDDSEAVEQLQQINKSLDGVAANMQKVVDDMQAKKDAGNDIGGTTSPDTVSGNQATLNSGTQSFDTFTDTATGQLDSITSGASGYAALMTMAMPAILNFGPSGGIGPLHIALLVIVAIFGLSFFIRRLL